MPDFAAVERQLTTTLGLTRRPVAVAFRESPPHGVARLHGTQPSGCSFWRLASAGLTFYTVPSDHYNCPIGCYTHNMPLPEEREPELVNALTLFVNVGYMKMAEVPSIPRLTKTPAVAIYAPLGATPVDPDAVLVTGKPGRVLQLHEAAARALADRATQAPPMLGRPTCMAIPAAIASGFASSLGCVGNRIYTETPDDEFYSVIAGKDLASVVAELETIASANAALSEYHAARRASLTA